MDNDQKKLALRAINYGLYVLTARNGDQYGAGGVNWLSQASFDPPLVMAGVKADSGSAAIIGETGAFAVNVLAGDQLDIGKAFFRSTSVEDGKINGYAFEDGPETGAPLLTDTPYWFECRVTPWPGATTRCTWPKWSTPACATPRPCRSFWAWGTPATWQVDDVYVDPFRST